MFLSGEPFRRRDLSQHAPKQPSRQVALCKQQPRLQARERPVEEVPWLHSLTLVILNADNWRRKTAEPGHTNQTISPEERKA
jgi:hypothetical protein